MGCHHFPSFAIIFLCFLSFSVVFRHLLSFSVIFCHSLMILQIFLSFSAWQTQITVIIGDDDCYFEDVYVLAYVYCYCIRKGWICISESWQLENSIFTVSRQIGNGPFSTKISQPWQICQLSKVVQICIKSSIQPLLGIWDHLRPFWAHLNQFGKKHRLLFGQLALGRKENWNVDKHAMFGHCW